MHDCERHAERAFSTLALGRSHTVVSGGRQDALEAYMLHYRVLRGGHTKPPYVWPTRPTWAERHGFVDEQLDELAKAKAGNNK